jgi:hypothetical protein
MDEILSLSQLEIVTIFNDELKTFLTELLKIVNQLKNITDTDTDNINKLLSYKNLIETGISANKEIAIDMFAGYIFSAGNEQFCEKISSKDYEFFYKMEEQIDKTNKLSEIIMIIKNLFIELSEVNKESIFGYLENLSTLSNIYAMKKIENK